MQTSESSVVTDCMSKNVQLEETLSELSYIMSYSALTWLMFVPSLGTVRIHPLSLNGD